MPSGSLTGAIVGLFVLWLAGFVAPLPVSAASADYRISGSTVYDNDELLLFAHQHVLRHVGSVSPDHLAEAIELIYREDGYLLAEARIVPAHDGRSLVIVVSEGWIETISIEGVDERLFNRIKSYLAPLVGKAPLTQRDLERAISFVDDLAGVSVITEIDYPDNASGARLRVIGAADRFAGSAAIDNPPRRFGKDVTASISQEFYSTLLAGDLLRLQGAVTLHGNDGTGYSLYGMTTYRAPIGRRGAYVEAYLGNV